MLKRHPMLHVSCSSAAEARIMNGRTGQAAAEKGSMGTVLDDVTSDTVDATHIRRRVDDWEERVNGLYAMIGDWLPDGWEARPGTPVLMHEPLMRKFGMDAKSMPTIELHDRAGQVARLKPRGLWIIGENGRVDLKHDGHYYFLMDTAENFAQPNWEVSRADRRCDREAVSREWLKRVLQ